MDNCNFHFHSNGCSCHRCENESKSGCMSQTFCKSCGVKAKNIKVCPVCQSEYSLEYEKCPVCFVMDKEKE